MSELKNLIIISNRKLCLNENLESQIEKILSAYKEKKIFKNFNIINLTLRENDLNENEYSDLLKKISSICKKYKINLYIHEKYKLLYDKNDFIDGIHLKFNTFKSISENKTMRNEIFKKFKNIAVSIHSITEAKEAEILGAHHLIAGHIFYTDCKKDLKPKGLNFLNDLCSSVKIPVYAIGGINESNFNLALNNGAFGVCMMSSLMKY